MVKILFYALVKAKDMHPKDLVGALWNEIIFDTMARAMFFAGVDV